MYSNSDYLTGLVRKIRRHIACKGLTQCLTHRKYSVKAIIESHFKYLNNLFLHPFHVVYLSDPSFPEFCSQRCE